MPVPSAAKGWGLGLPFPSTAIVARRAPPIEMYESAVHRTAKSARDAAGMVKEFFGSFNGACVRHTLYERTMQVPIERTMLGRHQLRAHVEQLQRHSRLRTHPWP